MKKILLALYFICIMSYVFCDCIKKCCCQINCSNNCVDCCSNSCPNNCDCNSKCTNDKNEDEDKSKNNTVNNFIEVGDLNFPLNITEKVVNLTTQVNIENIIHNNNSITVPVAVNTTNYNYIGIINRPSNKTTPIIININNTSTDIDHQPKCCYIYLPMKCTFFFSTNKVECIRKKHKECGSQCTSTIIVMENDQSAPLSCYYAQNSLHCGRYQKNDCEQCYYCGFGYNPAYCSQSENCPRSCRRPLPNCVPNISGLICS